MSSVAEAGAIVVKLAEQSCQLLLVKAKHDLSHWIFPKGHIEANESPSEAALREAKEEAGVVTDVVGRVGGTRFKHQGQEIHVEYYLLRYLGETHSAERRELTWCTYEEALRRLTFEETRSILQAAQPMISMHFLTD